MSVYMCEELVSTLTATVTFTGSNRVNFAGFKMGLVCYGAPAGTFTVSIKSGATTLWSDTFDSAELKSDLSTVNDNLYIFKGFSTDLKLLAGTYTIELSSSGYTYAESSFLGWIKDTDSFQTVTGGTNPLDENSPYFILIYENKKQELLWA